jgi:hypothetical protein
MYVDGDMLILQYYIIGILATTQFRIFGLSVPCPEI